MPRIDLIQLRGGTAAEWTAANPVLADREAGYEKDTGRIKVGDGSTAWTALSYRFETAPGASGVSSHANQASFPATGQTNVIYIANDTNLLYRWDGSAYVGVGGEGNANLTNYYTKTETDSKIAEGTIGLFDDRGNYNASVNTFPSSGGSGTAGAILKGDIWTVSQAGTLGGTSVIAGQTVRALVDSPGQTASNWAISVGSSQAAISTNTENREGTNNSKAITPLGLRTELNLKAPTFRFNIKDFGAKGDGVTDDTVAIQSAINACVAAGGGTVFFPYSANQYIIAGALQTSINGVNPNCQLYIPLVSPSDYMVNVMLEGESPSNIATETFGGITRTKQGIVLESTITGSGTRPAVIGSPYASLTGVGNRTYLYLHMKNIIVRTKTTSGSTQIAGTMSAINGQYLLGLTMHGQVKVDITSSLANSVLPTNDTYGVIFPAVNNKGYNAIDTLIVEGYKHGAVLQEHTTAKLIVSAGCVNGLVVDRGFHAIHIQRYGAEAVNNNINFIGEANVVIEQMDTEHQESGWYSWQYDAFFTTPTSTIVSNLNFVRTKSLHIKHFNQVTPSYGVKAEFKTNNTENVYIEKINEVDLNKTIQVIPETTWDCFKGKKAIKTANSNTAMTITNLFENDELGLIYIQDAAGGRSLTINGASVTLPSVVGNSISKVNVYNKNNTLYFETAAVSPADIIILLADTFTRPDSLTSIGSLETGSQAWTVVNGVWGIRNNRGYNTNSATASNVFYFITADAGANKNDITAEVVIIKGSGNMSMQLLVRYQDTNNFYALELSGGAFTFYKRVGGTYTTIGASHSHSLSVGQSTTIKVKTSGTSLYTYLNGALIHSVVDSSFTTGSKVGILRVAGPADTGNHDIDNFSVY